MGEHPPDPGPDEFLRQHNLYLRELFVGYDEATASGAGGEGHYVPAILKALTLHVRIEEQVCFPSLLTLRSPAVRNRVAGARNAHAAIHKLVESLAADGESERHALLRTIEPMVEAYLEFEERQLLPCLSSLPEGTLREMSLEIQDLMARQGRFH